MFFIYCGEDNVSSYQAYQDEIHRYRVKGAEIQGVSFEQLQILGKSNDVSLSLFSQTIVYTSINLSSSVSRLKAKDSLLPFERLEANEAIIVLDWEDGKSARELKLSFAHHIKESKSPRSIFQLLDGLYPGNIESVERMFQDLTSRQDAMFLFTMISRHLHALLLAQQNLFSARTQPWQKGKLANQAKKWSSKQLETYLEGLHRADTALKTGSSPLTMAQSLEILFVHCL